MMIVPPTKQEAIRNIRQEIYWIFRNAIHNGHREVRFINGRVEAHNPKEEKYQGLCYVCHTINKLEKEISQLFGEKYFTDTLPKTTDSFKES